MKEKFEMIKNCLYEMNMQILSEDPAEELVVIDDEENGIKNMIIDCEAPIVVIEQGIMKISDNIPGVFKRILQINRNIVHGAFVLDETGENLIFRDTLQLENLDRNELEASIRSLSLALSEYSNELLSFIS